MKLQKKHYIAAGIGVISLSLAFLYLQYEKLKDYCISFKSTKIQHLGLDKTIFDVFLNFLNKSSLKVDILSQNYKVYLNDKLISTASNDVKQTIAPNSTSVIGVNVQFSPNKAINAVNTNDLILNQEKVKIKIEMNLKVAFYFLKISIPYVYEGTLKDITSGIGTNKSTENKQKC